MVLARSCSIFMTIRGAMFFVAIVGEYPCDATAHGRVDVDVLVPLCIEFALFSFVPFNNPIHAYNAGITE